MKRERHVDALMTKLVKAIEVSLAAAEAAREAVQEILKRGAETGIFFAGAKASGAKAPGAKAPGAKGAEQPFELTAQDREFLRAVLIRPDPR
jgi:hypothetical protein